jgi:SAM-dependent methyltransferase
MTDGPTPLPLCESLAFQETVGPALRPGGLELTRRGLAFCGLPEGARVVDVGCGKGETVRFLREAYRLEAVGLDRSDPMLAGARQETPGLPLVRGEAACLPFRHRSLAAVVCECVLSLVADPVAAWREWARVLVPGGFLILADLYLRTPGHFRRPGSQSGACCLQGAGGRSELLDHLRQHGFSPVVWEDHTAYLKHLAARLVFAGWPLASLRGAEGACAAVSDPSAIPRARPGYFLAVARKRGVPC